VILAAAGGKPGSCISKITPLKGNRKMAMHCMNAPNRYVVEEKFGGYFNDHDDVSLAEVLQDQVQAFLLLLLFLKHFSHVPF
jgi:NADPH-dependent curcumin reductase CurA